MERRVIHAWVKAHQSDCGWHDERADEGCTCGAECIEIESDFTTPLPLHDPRGFVIAARRAIIAGAIELAKGEN